MTLEDRYNAIMSDPKKKARVFKFVVITAYSVMMLGFFLILWVLYKAYV